MPSATCDLAECHRLPVLTLTSTRDHLRKRFCSQAHACIWTGTEALAGRRDHAQVADLLVWLREPPPDVLSPREEGK